MDFGERLGALLSGGEVIELVGDVGAGKTTLTKSIARGMAITDTISSPSYTLSQVYQSPSGVKLIHYDFYRLDDPGILAAELEEVLKERQAVIIIEWGAVVAHVLPEDHIEINISATDETVRHFSIRAGGETSQKILEKLR